MSWRWTPVAVLAGALLAFAGEPHAGVAAGKVSQQVVLDTARGQQTSFVVYLAAQADLGAASRIADEDARGRYVYDALRREARRTQGPVKAQLKAQGLPYRSYWAANMIVARGDRSDVVQLARRPDVAAIETASRSSGSRAGKRPTRSRATSRRSTHPALEAGYTGQGIVSEARTPACAGPTTR